MSTRTLLQYAGMAFAAAMVMGMQIDEVTPTVEPTRIASDPPAASRSAAPATSAKPTSPPQSPHEQPPAAPGQEAMELRVPLARGVVQA